MNIANTVIVAGFEKPLMPSSIEICVHGPRTINTTMTMSAVTSTETTSLANSANARRVIPKTTSMFVVIGGSSTPTWSSIHEIVENNIETIRDCTTPSSISSV